MAEVVNVTVDSTSNVNDITIGDSAVTNNITVSDAGSVDVSITDGIIVSGSLSGLSDVNISSLQDGQYLVYDSASSKWTNTTTYYKHHQNNAAMIWDITHNLNLADYLPNVVIKLSGGIILNPVQAMGLVEYVDQNRLKINFLNSKSGYAYLKK